MNDSTNYAVTAEPTIYTVAEMKVVRDELNISNGIIESLRSQFFDYKYKIQDKGWKAQSIVLDLDRNIQAAEQLHLLCGNSETFMEGYNNARTSEVLFLLTQDNMLKLKELKELQESQD